MSNLKKNKKFHFTYKTTNLINNRYYLGMHSTNTIKDGYLGSGKRLYYELNKYGKENFKFEIIEHFNSREELILAEVKLITEEDLTNPNCLNLKQGGSGGFSNETHRLKFDDGRVWGRVLGGITSQKILKNNPEKKKLMLEKTKNSLKEYYKNNSGHFKNKKHSEETKIKIGISNSNKQKGCDNSQYGTCWITNEIENRKIHKGDLIPEGWRLGRKITNKTVICSSGLEVSLQN